MDGLDRRIVAALQADGRATWRQVARVVDTSESTVARRAQRLIDEGLIAVTCAVDPIRCGLGYPVLLQLKCEVGASGAVARRLAERPDVRYVALITGVFDIVCELIVPSRRRLARILLDEFSDLDGVIETTTESVLRNFKMSYDWSWALLGQSGPAAVHDAAPAPDAPPPEPADLELIQLLAEDGRRSVSDLASTLGMSESMARRRLEALKRDGFVRFATLVDPNLLGYDIEAFVWLRVDLARLEEIAGRLAAQREVRYLSATTGFSDLTAEIVLEAQDDLYAFSTGALAELPGIRQVVVGLELETLKRAYLPMRNYRWRGRNERATRH